jgi:hypothetical protein
VNKKIIGVILFVFIITTGLTPVIATPSRSDTNIEFTQYIEKVLKSTNQTFGDHFIITLGPVLKIFSNVELTKGSESQMKLIQRYLDRKLLRPLGILRVTPIFVENLSFTVEYKQDVKNGSRYSYITVNGTVIWDENGIYQNITDISYNANKKHTVTVENLTGFFMFFRFRLFNLGAPIPYKIFQPAKFTFIGFCDGITISRTG